MPTTSDDHAVAPSANPRRRRLLILLSSITVVVLVLDQLSKVWALDNLEEHARRVLVGDLLGLQLVFNPGAALSIATGMTWVLTVVAVAVIVFIVRASRRIGSRGWAIALGLLLGGALGNLGDRLFRAPGFARGEVVDFIAYWNVFVGNVADIAIVVAAIMIVILAATGVHIDGTRDGHDEPSDDSSDDAVAVADADADVDSAAGEDEPPVTDPGSSATSTSEITEGSHSTTEQNA
ncbi:signal peptidase II [Cellulomonas sp. URHE0023]|uniref:signal peptidase II n=1 Tax=Cellulomonas sp. URHE0023 TaxID=1380354 RepID=UPI0009DCB909|nr:signal peptidase II [Cellulomonas sp. URHE0023]